MWSKPWFQEKHYFGIRSLISETAAERKDEGTAMSSLDSFTPEQVCTLSSFLALPRPELEAIGVSRSVCTALEKKVSVCVTALQAASLASFCDHLPVVCTAGGALGEAAGGACGFGSAGSKGALHLIGTCGGALPFVNPVTTSLVAVNWSSVLSGPSEMLADHQARGWTSRTGDSVGSWMELDLKQFRLANLSHYYLRHGYGSSKFNLLKWKLLGSSGDNEEWAELDVQSFDALESPWPKGGYTTIGFPIAAAPASLDNPGLRFFRLVQTGANRQETHSLACAGMELFGTLTRDETVSSL